jgi:hypothetical protein
MMQQPYNNNNKHQSSAAVLRSPLRGALQSKNMTFGDNNNNNNTGARNNNNFAPTPTRGAALGRR